MPEAVPGRVASLDLIRGVAVLGILAINIAGFAGPVASVSNPNFPAPGGTADTLAFAAKFVIFEGKMRALFTLLFGASLVLFVERADASGQFGELLQLRRLFWLALFGLAHFYLLWWGDILFLYAACGTIALLMRESSVRMLWLTALAVFSIWHIAGAALDAPAVMAEQRVARQTASIAETEEYAAYESAVAAHAREETAVAQGGFGARAVHQLTAEMLHPFTAVVSALGETLPLMLIGMALYRTGFFGNTWPPRRMAALAMGATLCGLALTAAFLAWAWTHGFPPRAMTSAVFYWLAIPHLLMALGYAALLVLATPALTETAAGLCLAAAGKMAFSNYIGTSLAMTAIFYGWGLGLYGSAAHGAQWLFVLFGWVGMLAWSAPWLRHFRHGPLEWLWRSLTEKRLVAIRR